MNLLNLQDGKGYYNLLGDNKWRIDDENIVVINNPILVP